MEFLHTGLLWGFLPLVAIPVILHLLTLHRLKTVELSTFRFLFDTYVQQRRRMKLMEFLVALLRTAFLLFLVFSLSRPVIKHWDSLFGDGGSGQDVVLLIDGSASMEAVTDGQTAMARAKDAALRIVDRLGPEDRVTLYLVGAQPTEICNRFSSDAESIREEIHRLETTPSRSNLFTAFAAVNARAEAHANQTVYLLSDLQSSGWTEITEELGESVLPPGQDLVVVNVGSSRAVDNRGVTGGAPRNERAIVGLPVTLRPQVSNFSESTTETVNVNVFIDDREIARREVTLKPGETGETEVVYTPDQPGVIRGRYEVAGDRFTADDSYLFTITVAPRIQVVLVNGFPSVEPLDDEGFYVRTAVVSTETDFQPESSDDGDDESEAADEVVPGVSREFIRSLDLTEIPENAVTAEAIADAEVVVLANCGSLQPPQYQLLCEYVHRGGGLIILLGDKVDPKSYSEQFLAAPYLPDESLAAVTLAVADDTAPQNDAFGTVDLAHAIFEVFAGDNEEQYLRNIRVSKRWTMTLNEDTGSTWPVVAFTDSAPALVESRFGFGRVVVSAFPFNSKWSNLPMRPEFVPLVLRTVGHVQRAAELNGPSVVTAEGVAEISVSQDWTPASAKVTDDEGRVTPMTLERSNRRLKGAFEGTVDKGFYKVDVTGGRTESPKQGTLAFAVNLDSEESNLSPLTTPQLKKRLPNANVKVVDASAEAQQLYGSIGDEREVWRPLILLLFAIIAAEFLLSTLSGRSSENQQSTTERIRTVASGAWVRQVTGGEFEEEAEVATASSDS